jgi:hypothetical protein
LWITPQTICLNASVWCILCRTTKDNSLTTLVSWGTQNAPKKILKGTYEYPPDTNVWTKKILQEAHYTFSCMSGAKIATTISTADFQQYWIKVDKRTSSFFSGVTFFLLALQSSGISFNALSNAHSVSVCVHTKRDPPCMIGDWAHCATGDDSWQ